MTGQIFFHLNLVLNINLTGGKDLFALLLGKTAFIRLSNKQDWERVM